MDTSVQTIITIASMLLLVAAAIRDWNKSVRDAGSNTFKELQTLYDAVKKELTEERVKREALEKTVEVLKVEVQELKDKAKSLAQEISRATSDLAIARDKIALLEKELDRKQAVLDELLNKIKGNGAK